MQSAGAAAAVVARLIRRPMGMPHKPQRLPAPPPPPACSTHVRRQYPCLKGLTRGGRGQGHYRHWRMASAVLASYARHNKAGA